MGRLTPHQVIVMFLALGTLLAVARALGEVARRFSQPAVLGEILAGILLGPTVLGALAPTWLGVLFPAQGRSAFVMDGLTTLAIALFLLVAGMEVSLSTIWRQGKAAFAVGIAGIVFPFLLGFGVAALAPGILGPEPGADPLVFALFFATALSISALPVIVKTLRDIGLYRTDLGMVVVAAAIFNDLIGWILFATTLGLIGVAHGHAQAIAHTIELTLAFVVGMLTVGRWLIHRSLPWIQAHTSWPGGVLGFAVCLGLFGAAFTEWIGIHAVFGAFIVGVAIGDSPHFRERSRETIDQFVSYIFAPLFFASIGLRVNFATHFDWFLTLVVIVIACVGKVVGCGMAARLSGMPRREALAVALGLNARGAMEIILGLLALNYGVIHERMFVALVLMALVTSMISGPAMQRILRRKQLRRFTDHLTPRAFLTRLRAHNRQDAIRELSQAISTAAGLTPELVEAAVSAREQLMPTGIGCGVAVPHARLDGLAAPVVGVGLTKAGVDFDAPDGQPAQVIFLVLTPKSDNGAELEILADIARTFTDAEVRDGVLQVGSYTEFLALMKAERAA